MFISGSRHSLAAAAAAGDTFLIRLRVNICIERHTGKPRRHHVVSLQQALQPFMSYWAGGCNRAHHLPSLSCNCLGATGTGQRDACWREKPCRRRRSSRAPVMRFINGRPHLLAALIQRSAVTVTPQHDGAASQDTLHAGRGWPIASTENPALLFGRCRSPATWSPASCSVDGQRHRFACGIVQPLWHQQHSTTRRNIWVISL